MSTASNLLKKGTANWNLLLQTSAAVMTALAGFVLPPPIWAFEQNLIWYRFAQFLVAILIGLMLVPATNWNAKRDTTRWITVTIISVMLGTGAFFGYRVLVDGWTIPYDHKQVIKGSTYSEMAIAYKARIHSEEKREISDEDLLMSAAGNREDIWNLAEIQHRGHLLAAVYLACILSFALAIFSIIQVVFCNFSRRAERP